MKKTVLIFGDSNTWGWKPENDLVSPLQRWDDDIRWPGVLQKELGSDYKVLADGLNGRTTVWNDPIEEYRCGKNQIIPTMDAQAPFDMIIIFVGTNDLKVRYTVSAQDIANGVAILVNKAKNQVGDFIGDPKILLVAPPPLGPVNDGVFKYMFGGNEDKSKELSKFYEAVAKANGVEFFDAGKTVKSSNIDGLHLDADQHEILGKSMVSEVKRIIG